MHKSELLIMLKADGSLCYPPETHLGFYSARCFFLTAVMKNILDSPVMTSYLPFSATERPPVPSTPWWVSHNV